MPTARGWTVMVTGFGLWAAGRAFGASPLEQLGFALVVLVALAVGVVNLGRHDLVIARQLRPERAGAGAPVQVSLNFVNRGRGPAPLLLLSDRLPSALAGHARFALRGVEPGGQRNAGYVVRAPGRGSYEIGPLEITYVDPFALARVRTLAAGTNTLLVYPRIDKLTLPRDGGEQRSLATAALRQPVGLKTEDFYTLREFVEGDDLRRIHWPATAKRDRPMIRQEETPWHTRATVLLDDRAEAHGGIGELSGFERAVEAAASLVDLYHRSGYSWRLGAVHEPGLPPARGAEHRARCLDLLAAVEARPGDGRALLTRLAELERAGQPEGALVLAGGTLELEGAAALSRCRRRFKTVIALLFPAHRFGLDAPRDRWQGEAQLHDVLALLRRAGVRTLVVGPGESLAGAWLALAGGVDGGVRWALRAGRA
jgi:uncharacterized protein (DUF58 family)